VTTTNVWSTSVPRAELDQRSRAARLRLEQIDRLLIPPRAAVAHWPLRRFLCRFDAEYSAAHAERIAGAAESAAVGPKPQ
jgi:hypothetical protein